MKGEFHNAPICYLLINIRKSGPDLANHQQYLDTHKSNALGLEMYLELISMRGWAANWQFSRTS